MDTPLDFSAFMLNWLKVDTLTPELLAGPTFELMKGPCKSLVELEYFLEEVCKATIDQLDWNNPEGQQYPHDLRKPLPLLPNSRGNLLMMSTPETESLELRSLQLSNGIITNIWNGSLFIEMTTSYTHSKKATTTDFAFKTSKTCYFFLFKASSQISTLRNILLWVSHYECLQEALSSEGNRDKKNKLMRIDEHHKFSDGTLNDVRSALNDILKRIRMEYLPQTV
ncbi:hypothetical protein Tco_1349523 [Tanacetum coccineum]